MGSQIFADLEGTLKEFFFTEGGYTHKTIDGKPLAPPEGYFSIYFREDGLPYYQTSEGHQYPLTSSGISESVTVSGINGIVTYYQDGVWYIDGSGLEEQIPGIHRIRGQGEFVPSGYQISHNAGTADHHIDFTIAGTDLYNEYSIASVGEVFIETGVNTDTVYNTGGVTTSGIPFIWEVSYSTEEESNSTAIRGLSTFDSSGKFINHNLGTLDHFTSISPAGSANYDEYDSASIGHIYVKLGFNTDIVYATGGDQVTGLPFSWEISTDLSYETEYATETVFRGVSYFSEAGTTLTHNLGSEHFTSIIPASSSTDYDEYDAASLGNIYIKLGSVSDIIYHTGGARAEGYPFYWEISVSGAISQSCVTFEQLLTLSGALVSYVDQQIADITNLIPSVTASGNLMGTGVFTYATGYTITHNLGTTLHYVSVTPAGTEAFDEYLIASLGQVYVRKGEDEDIVFHTGGTRADGLKFDWEVIEHGLKMVE